MYGELTFVQLAANPLAQNLALNPIGGGYLALMPILAAGTAVLVTLGVLLIVVGRKRGI